MWHGGNGGEPDLLASCYYNSLKIAMDNGIGKIAFPSISTGVYSYPVDKAAKIAVDTVERFVRENQYAFDLIEWVLFDDRTFAAYDAEIDKLY